MFHSIRSSYILLLLFFMPGIALAQAGPGDIRPTLKSLSHQQKLQILEYLQHLGADLDNTIQHAYSEVSKQNQIKAARFIETLKEDATGKTSVTEVRWDKDTLFFGDLEEGTILIDSFQVTNTGKFPYIITRTQATCDCTVVQAPDYPIMPGESIKLRINFNSSGKLGVSKPAVIIYDNSTPNKRSILYLNGNITPRKRPRKYPWEN